MKYAQASLLLTALGLIVSLNGCGTENSSNNNSNDTNMTSNTQPTTTQNNESDKNVAETTNSSESNIGSGVYSDSNNENNTNNTEPDINSGVYATGEFGTITLKSDYTVPEDAILLDIRNNWERSSWNNNQNYSLALGSIGGAVYEYREPNSPDKQERHVRDEFITEVLGIVNNNKDQHLILICNSAARTEQAATLLSNANFTHIEHISAGMNDWLKYQLPTGIYQDINVDENYQIPQDALLIDIRNEWEKANGNYPTDSLTALYEYREPNRPDKQERYVRNEFVSDVLALTNDNKNREVILICNSAARTSVASKLLVENGFKNVGHIVGGIYAWKSKGLPTGN